jgi:ZIP family zinc transporter
MATLTGIPTCLGAVLGLWLGSVSKVWMSWCLGFAAGAMLYVTMAEMVPQVIKAEGRHKTLWQLVGFTLGVVVSWL